MKSLCLLLLVAVFCFGQEFVTVTESFTEPLQIFAWNYLKGSLTDVPPDVNVYGNPGQAGSTFHPSSRDGAASWTDLTGNLWLYGGLGDSGSLADLWMLSPTTQNWAWIGGSPIAFNLVANINDGVPPSTWDPASWSDGAGNFYFFGGEENSVDHNLINQLWMYDGTNWVFVAGSANANEPPTYGSLGVAAIGNHPGARKSSAGWFQADASTSWIFGGFGIDSNANAGLLNDLWNFNSNTGEWTWVSGSNVIDAVTTTSVPGARQGVSYWTNNGNFYIYGGQDVTGNALAELWSWSPTNSEWTFYPNAAGPAVYWAQAKADSNGNVWLFGGNKNATTFFNDLWLWNGVTWTLLVGSKLSNTPSIINGTAATNVPSARSHNALWTSGTTVWLYGGEGFGLGSTTTSVNLGDLWQVYNTTISFTFTANVTMMNDLYDIPTEGIIVVAVVLLVPFFTIFIFAAVLDLQWHNRAKLDKWSRNPLVGK